MTTIQEALGETASLEIGGKTYQVGPTTVEVVRQWEQWMTQETMAKMISASSPLGPDIMPMAFDAVARLAAKGEFEFFGEASLHRMNTIDGKAKLLFWRMVPNHPDVQEKDVRAMVETEAIKVAMALRERQNLPNAEAPSEGPNQASPLGNPSSPKSSNPPDGTSTASADSA